MSDQTKYINAYVDTAVGILHEQLNLFLQTKAQLKVANDLIQEKDGTIATLQSELAAKTDEFNVTNHSLMEARHWEAEYNSMKNKVSHMETLTSQLVDMKRMIQEKDEKITELNSQLQNLTKLIQEKDQKLETLKSQPEIPTPVINNKQKKKSVDVEIIKNNNSNSNIVFTTSETDDF